MKSLLAVYALLVPLLGLSITGGRAAPVIDRDGSNILAAGNLRGALRIMHGTSDINASLSSTMRMTDALIQADKHFELLIMPGQPHSPEGQAQRYYNDDVRMFFLRTLQE
jgi:dipeptidyl aminopeptidase/acylaminoacyl peptidase